MVAGVRMPDQNFTLDYWKSFPGPFPQLLFFDNAFGGFSFLVKNKTHNPYGHFAWLIGPDDIASQWWYFRQENFDHYRKAYIKVVGNPLWTDFDREKLISAIETDLSKPWWKTIYDVPGVAIGELFGINFQIPWLYFCSERGEYLKLIYSNYDLKHPDPGELDHWTRGIEGFEVTGRYWP